MSEEQTADYLELIGGLLIGKYSITGSEKDLKELRAFVQNVENFRRELEKDGDVPYCRAWARMRLKSALEGS